MAVPPRSRAGLPQPGRNQGGEIVMNVHDLARREAPTGRVAALRTAATQASRIIVVPRDRMIHAEGDRTDHWYEVLAGAVRICKLTPDGRRQIVDLVLPGEVFGFDGWDRHATSAEAASIEGATVRRHSRRHLESLADDDASVARQVRQVTSSGLARAHERLLLLGRRTATERVALFLLEMQERLRAGPDSVLALPVARTEIGDYLGLTMETVSRIIGGLHRSGIITLLSCQILRLDDRAALLAAAGHDADDPAVLPAQPAAHLHLLATVA
jgi:CRP/FNR family nitrogen fixation transcriptional regulator